MEISAERIRKIPIYGGSVMLGIDLRGTDLTGANLQEVNLRNARLKKAVSRGAKLDFADLIGAKFCNTIMPNGDTAIKDC